MSRRVLILGTSHCAALRAAVGAAVGADRQSDALTWGGMTLRFAAIPNDHAAALRLDGGVLTAGTDTAGRMLWRLNRQGRFALSEFDAVAMLGGLMSAFAITRLYTEARWFPLPSLIADGGAPPPGLPLISDAAALAALCGRAETAALFALLRSLHAAMPGRVFVVQDPRVSHDAIGTGRKFMGFTRIARGPDASEVSALYDRAVGAAFGGLARVIVQPAATRAGAFFTDARFRRGATRLAATPDMPQPPDDMLHGNAGYGAAVLDDLARAVAV